MKSVGRNKNPSRAPRPAASIEPAIIGSPRRVDFTGEFSTAGAEWHPIQWAPIERPAKWTAIGSGHLSACVRRVWGAHSLDYCGVGGSPTPVIVSPIGAVSEPVRAGLGVLIGNDAVDQYRIMYTIVSQAVTSQLEVLDRRIEEKVDSAFGARLSRLLAARTADSDAENSLRQLAQSVRSRADSLELLPLDEALGEVDIAGLFDSEQ